MKIAIYGTSDDTIAVGVNGQITDEYDAYGHTPVTWAATLYDPASGGQMRVLALWSDCWRLAFGQVDEDHAMPGWPVTLRQHPQLSYSVMAEVEVPDGTELVDVREGDDA